MHRKLLQTRRYLLVQGYLVVTMKILTQQSHGHSTYNEVGCINVINMNLIPFIWTTTKLSATNMYCVLLCTALDCADNLAFDAKLHEIFASLWEMVSFVEMHTPGMFKTIYEYRWIALAIYNVRQRTSQRRHQYRNGKLGIYLSISWIDEVGIIKT